MARSKVDRTTAATESPVTQADLVKALIAEAIKKGIPLAELVKGVGAEAKVQRDAEAAVTLAKQAKLASISAILMERFVEMVEEHADDLEVADGVWLEWDFSKGTKGCKLLTHAAAAPRAPSGSGGGGGRKVDITTEALVAKYTSYMVTNEDVAKRDDKSWAGHTISEVAAMVKGQKNPSYQLRMFLLKKAE